MGGRFASADDPEDVISFNFNIHHEEKPRPRGDAKDQQPIRMGQIWLDQGVLVVEDRCRFLEGHQMFA